MLEFLNYVNCMRIQEMRSGLLHLKRKMESERAKDIFETHTLKGLTGPQSVERSSVDSLTSELEEPRWAVISFERTEAAGLTFWQASRRMEELDSQGVAGLCIVTDDAAARLNG